MKKQLTIFFITTALCSCDLLVTNNEELQAQTDEIVAKAGESVLLRSDIEELIGTASTFEDSSKLADNYVKNWIKKELLLQEASNNVNIDQSEIEKKVSDYRYTLLSFEYQRLYIQQNLDTAVSDQEIEEYYNENKENFGLRQNIFKGKFIKLNKEAPKKSDVRRWMKSLRPESQESLKDYAFQYANNYSLDTTWVKFEEITRASPFSTLTNKVQFLRRTNYAEEADSLYLYLLKIDEYKLSEEISPLTFVENDIRNIILNSRKVALAKGLENEIFERAKENEDYTIYR